MPGANCSILNCNTSRKHKGISIFKVPSEDDDFNKQWRENLVKIITKDRVIDASLRGQIENKTLHVCELHYDEKYLIRGKKKTTRIPGSLPTLNLPIKSCPSTVPAERSTTSIQKRSIATATCTATTPVQIDCYKSFEDFLNRIQKLKLPPSWEICINNPDFVIIKFTDTCFNIPKFQIYVQKDLCYKLLVFNWKVQESNNILKNTNFNFKNIHLSSLVKKLQDSILCEGVDFESDRIIKHVVPKAFNPFLDDTNLPLVSQVEFSRPSNCQVLCQSSKCKNCHEKELQKRKQERITAEKAKEPLKNNAPLSLVSPDRMKNNFIYFKIENKRLQHENLHLQKLIEKSAVPATESLDKDLKSIMSNADPSKVSTFLKFFWDEQMKYLQSSSKSVRYHPSIIRYCLSLAAKSSSAYEDLRFNEKTGTGFLILPSQRRLRDYRNYIRPKRGFNNEIIDELIKKTADFSDGEKNVVLLLDEMKIQENLVWDKHSGELIGYVDLGDEELNHATLEKVESVATHLLVFMLRGIVNPIKFSLANFATTGITAAQLFPLFWRAVSILELKCKLKLMAVTCDGASSNRKFFRMHEKMTDEEHMNPDVDVIYRTINLFSRDRYIYFVSDVPHLLKTARNCLFNSGSGTCSRFMWNDGMHLLWSHIREMFYDDINHGLHIFPKLTYDHINLTSYSKMNVRLAVQVLSHTMGEMMMKYGSKESIETANFCNLMDSFFDILNIRNKTECEHQNKPLLAPFYSADDTRLSWLTGGFLHYFSHWSSSIEARQGTFTKSDREKMFISRQTHEGLKITSHSISECVRFLLSTGVCKYVLTEHFCQDPLENYFGRQRSMGHRKDNPNLRDTGYNDNNIRNQKVFRPISAGNSGGADKACVEISNEPVPCRKRRKVTE